VEQAEHAAHVTGKFVMQIVADAQHDPTLEVVVELGQGVSPSHALEHALGATIRSALERQNSEFLNYAPAHRRTPRVRLLPLAHPEYFPLGVKHRYTR
jgi:phenylacetate-CoA ligase